MNGWWNYVATDQTLLWLLNVVIQATVTTALALLIVRCYRRRAVVRYWVLCIGLLLVLASPAVSALIQATGISWLTIETTGTSMAETTGDQVAAVVANNNTSDGPLIDPLATTLNPMTATADQQPDTTMADLARTSRPLVITDELASDTLIDRPQPVTNEPSRMTVFLRWIVLPMMLVWAVGTMLMLVRLAVGWVRMSRILRSTHPIHDPALQAAFAKACRTAINCDQTNPPALVTSPLVSGPLAAGILRPKVVLPTQLVETVAADELTDVLIHEIAHVVRRDQIVVLVQNLVAAIYWPHPLVRVLNRELAKAREEVCDNFVLAATDAPTYSRTLLSLAELVRQRDSLPGAVGFFTSRWKLEQRVAGLLDHGRDRAKFLSKRGWLFVGATSVALATLMWLGTITIANAQNDTAQTQEVASIGDEVTVRGVVLKPDGSPASGAIVRTAAPISGNMRGFFDDDYRLPITQIVADNQGRFEIPIDSEPYGELPVEGTIFEDTWTRATIAASLPGFAAHWTSYRDIPKGEPLILRLSEESIVQGRVIGMEGRPVDGVTIAIREAWKGKRGSLDGWLTAVRNGEPAWTAVKHLANYVEPRLLGVPDAVRSDSKGEFVIRGLGRDCYARLQCYGNGIAFNTFRIANRDLESFAWDVSGGSGQATTVYGSKFTLTGHPSRAVTGVAIDAESGTPLAGVEVAIEKLAGGNFSGNWHLPTRTDQFGKFRIDAMPKGKGNRLIFRPTDDQPYFMRRIEVPDLAGIEPMAMTAKLHRGIWIEGTVVDKETRQPVAGVRMHYLPLLTNRFADELPEFDRGNVDGQQQRYQTDHNGQYRLVGLPGPAIVGAESIHKSFRSGSGYGDVTAPKNGRNGWVATYSNPIKPSPRWPDAMAEIDPNPETQWVRLDIELDPGHTIDLSVFDESGKWLTGAVAKTGRSGIHQRIETDRSPVLVTSIAPNESRAIIVQHESRNLGIVHHITPTDISTGKLSLTAQRRGRISGQLVDAGKPLVGVSVIPKILPNGDFTQSLPTVTTDHNGRFESVLLPGCKYKLRMEGPTFVFAGLDEELEVSPGEETDLGTLALSKKRKFVRKNEPNAGSSATDTTVIEAPAKPRIKMREAKLNTGETEDLGTVDATADSGTASKSKPSVAGANPSNHPGRTTSSKTQQTPDTTDNPPPSQVSGRVIGASGKPVAGAKIYHINRIIKNDEGSRHVATSDANGAFTYTLPIPKEARHYEPKMVRHASVVAMVDGPMMAFGQLHAHKPGAQLELRFPKDDGGLSGRVLDIQGKPVSGASVKFNALLVPKTGSGGCAAWREAIEARRDGMKVQNKFFSYAYHPDFRKMRDQPAKTDTDGRFEIEGFGRDRIVSLIVEGPTIETHEICIVAGEKIEPITVPWYEHASELGTLRYLPNRAEYVAAPTRPIVGVVTDMETGEPLSGFRIAGDSVGNPFHAVDTTTDDQGRFRLTGLPLRKKQPVSVSSPEDQPYVAVERNVTLTENNKPLTVNLQAVRGTWATGKVVDLQTNHAVRARLQYFVMRDNEFYERLRSQGLNLLTRQFNGDTDGAGKFRIAVLPGNGVIVARATRDEYIMGIGVDQFDADGQLDSGGFLKTTPYLCYPNNYHAVAQVHPVDVESPVDLTIGLDPGLAAKGRIVDPAGKPLTDTFVRGLFPMSYWRWNDSSSFNAICLEDGKSRQLLFWNKEKNLAGRLVVDPGKANATARLQPAGTVTGRLLDKDGAPMADALVVSYNHGLNHESDIEHDFVNVISKPEIRTDRAGRFQITGLVPGLEYSFGHEYKSGRFPRLYIRDVACQSGETRDLGELMPLPGPHDRGKQTKDPESSAANKSK